jgi:predicted ferric reductase
MYTKAALFPALFQLWNPRLHSHPLIICSLPSTTPDEPSKITFYIRHRGGFTARLYNHARKKFNASLPVLVDGPYGGIDPAKYYSSDRLVVIALSSSLAVQALVGAFLLSSSSSSPD